MKLENEIDLKPMFNKISDIEKEKKRLDDEIDNICMDIMMDDFTAVNKLYVYPALAVTRKLGELITAYNYYILKNKKESDEFIKIFDDIFDYIITNNYRVIDVIKLLKTSVIPEHRKYINDISSSISDNTPGHIAIIQWNAYLLNKLNDIERAILKVEFINTSDDIKQLIFGLATVEYKARELELMLRESPEYINESVVDDQYIISYDNTVEESEIYKSSTDIESAVSEFMRTNCGAVINITPENDKVFTIPFKYAFSFNNTDIYVYSYIKNDLSDGSQKTTNALELVKKSTLRELCRELDIVFKLIDINDPSSLLDEGLKDTLKRTKAKISVADRIASEKIDKIADKIFGDIKSAKNEDERERIIRGSIPKASGIVKKALFTGATFLVSPVLSVIGAMTNVALSKKTRIAQRKMILHELEDELRITEEKFRDAESDGDRKKKYDLMRIQNKLERDIRRIKYNIKY